MKFEVSVKNSSNMLKSYPYIGEPSLTNEIGNVGALNRHSTSMNSHDIGLDTIITELAWLLESTVMKTISLML